MLTDAPPRKKNRQFFLESGRLRSIDLPADGRLLRISHAIESAMESGSKGRRAAALRRIRCNGFGLLSRS